MLRKCNNCFEDYDDAFDVCPFCGFTDGAAPEQLYQLYAGTVLADRYIVGKVLGFGGFGNTYMAWDMKLECKVAVKEYYPSGLVNRAPGTPEVILYARNRKTEFVHGLTRFLDEAKSTAKFSGHKNIINVFEYFEANGTAYIVMELLVGQTLSQYIHSHEEPLEIGFGTDIALCVCNALKEIHSAGIIHRDVSPDNIFLCDNGAVKLIDFGAARFSREEDRQLTIILKPGFAPPEQYEKVNTQGPWTDIYALGATMYYALSGKKPDESTNRRIKDEVAPLTELVPGFPEYLSNAVMKAIALDVQLRFSTVDELEKAIRQTVKVIPLKKEIIRRKRRRLLGISAALVIIGAGALVFSKLFFTQMEEETLPDGKITLWYSAQDDAKSAAFGEIIKDFSAAYENVTVELHPLPAAGYADDFAAALESGEKINVYEAVDGMSAAANSRELENVVSRLDMSKYYFLDAYGENFPEKKLLPLGFYIPVLYTNTVKTEFGFDCLGSLDEIGAGEEQPLGIDDACASWFSEMFGNEYSGYPFLSAENAAEGFKSGELLYLLSDSRRYLEIQSALPAQYSVTAVDSEHILCRFADLYGIIGSSDAENRISERFLLFLLSDNAQDVFHIRSNSSHIPLNKDDVRVFEDVYYEYTALLRDIDHFRFN